MSLSSLSTLTHPYFAPEKKSHRSVQTKPSSSRPNNRTNKQGADFLTPHNNDTDDFKKRSTHTRERTYSLTLARPPSTDDVATDFKQRELSWPRDAQRERSCADFLSLFLVRDLFLLLYYYYFSGVFHPP